MTPNTSTHPNQPDWITIRHLRESPLYQPIREALSLDTYSDLLMTDEHLSDHLSEWQGFARTVGADAYLVHHAIGFGMRLVIRYGRSPTNPRGMECLLVEGFGMGRPTIEVPPMVAKRLLLSNTLREMEEHDTKTHGGWRSSGIDGDGAQVYALVM
jgi:hypothetical protein